MKIYLKQGELIGKENSTIPSAKKYISYLGIPYAEPPVNLLRFQAPKPHKGWNGVLDATQAGAACPQKIFYVSPLPFGDEDCLYVNVHVPQCEYNKKNQKPKPVMVYVHGGGFLSGSGDFYEPSYLMEYDVIVVTFNYRLHVFGFLNLDLPECSGNMGLKDQALLFKWVRENISAFGGDPNNVTAVGESAGAASIHYLILSPLGRGLFDRAIIQSGSAFCPWAFTNKHGEFAFELGKILGCETTNRRELLNFLLEVSAADLSKAARKLTSRVLQSNIAELAFVPSVESQSHSNIQSNLLPSNPLELAEHSHAVPLLTGINDLESLIFITEIPMEILLKVHRNKNILPNELQSANNAQTILKEVESFYFKNNTPFLAVVDLLTDVKFAYPFEQTFQSMLKNHSDIPVFLYKFSYEGSLNLHKQFVSRLYSDIRLEGTSHSDELSYLFVLRALYQELSYNRESEMIQLMCTLWTNFVKYGKPSQHNSVQWKQTTSAEPCYLHIGHETRMKNGRINAERMIFWDNLIKKTPSRDKVLSKL